MSRADVLMRKIRDDIAVISNQKGAKDKNEIEIMENALIDLTRHITALSDIPQEEVTPHKEELIGIMAMMDNLTNIIEASKTESRQAVLDIVHKIKAQSSYNKK
tara:strand:+ start:69119 stop:69430 length:312 start_codon:yes stop_codon:yes gene_type:complete